MGADSTWGRVSGLTKERCLRHHSLVSDGDWGHGSGGAGSVEGQWRGVAGKEERQEIGVALVGCKMLTQHDGRVAPLTVELGPGGTALLVVLNLLHSSHSSCGTRRVDIHTRK